MVLLSMIPDKLKIAGPQRRSDIALGNFGLRTIVTTEHWSVTFLINRGTNLGPVLIQSAEYNHMLHPLKYGIPFHIRAIGRLYSQMQIQTQSLVVHQEIQGEHASR